MLVIYLSIIYKNTVVQKYPRMKKFFNYYETTSLIFILFEVLLCIVCLFFLIITGILYIQKKYSIKI
jgi:hypothetical protein